jgi:signal transduction histidine kinase
VDQGFGRKDAGFCNHKKGFTLAIVAKGMDRLGRLFSRFSRLSLAFVCAGFSAILFVLCVFVGLHFERSSELVFYRQTDNIAQMLLAGFEADSERVDAILMQIAGFASNLDISDANATELHRLLVHYVGQPSIIGPGIIDHNGVLIASALADSVPPLSLKERAVFRVHADHPDESKLFISVPTQGLLTNKWSIQFSRPLRDRAGVFQGVVIASYGLSHFIDLYEKLKISDRGIAALVGRDGVVRIRSLSGSIGYGSAVSKMALTYDRVLAGEKSGKFYGPGADDVTRIGTFLASDTIPFYVTVGDDEAYLRSQYIGFFYVLGICWFVLTAAMVASAIFIRHLEKARQRAQIDIVRAAIVERQNLSADMHDSIGASLAALLAHFASDNFNLVDVKKRISEILLELRFLVDSGEPVDGDLNVVLGNVRHRMGRGIELAGIEVRWRVVELPKIPNLTTRDALSIKLILMEALTNIMHHANAKAATVTANYDEEKSEVTVVVQDDGCGFMIADTAKGGRGISNMRKRIRAISTGADFAMESKPGHGTSVRLTLAVPRNRIRCIRPQEYAA